MSLITVTAYHCDRCGYEWLPRKRPTGIGEGQLPELPRTCPHCKSAYWNSPRKNKRRGDSTSAKSQDS